MGGTGGEARSTMNKSPILIPQNRSYQGIIALLSGQKLFCLDRLNEGLLSRAQARLLSSTARGIMPDWPAEPDRKVLDDVDSCRVDSNRGVGCQ